MHGQQRGGGAKFDGKIAVAHGVHGILRELRLAADIHKSEQLGDERAIQRQRGTGNRAAAERADVHARVAVPKPLAIAFEHLDVGEQMVREINGLRALQMRVAGNEHAGIFFAERDERALQIGDFAEQQSNFIAQPEAHVERDLVVAGAGGVEFGAGGNAPGQLRLDVHVDVFEFGLPFEFAGGDFRADGVESANDGDAFLFGQHADFVEHVRVGHRAEDVVPPEPPVEGDGFGELRDVGGGTAREASASGNGRDFFHLLEFKLQLVRARQGSSLNSDQTAPVRKKSHSEMSRGLQSNTVSVRPPERELSQLAAVPFAETGS